MFPIKSEIRPTTTAKYKGYTLMAKSVKTHTFILWRINDKQWCARVGLRSTDIRESFRDGISMVPQTDAEKLLELLRK